MSTLRQLVNSVDIHLQQTGDDKKIPPNQLVLWGQWLVNKYTAYKYQTVDTGAFLTIMPSVSVLKASTLTTNIILGEKYSVLPRAILDLEKDRGVDYITYARNDYPDNVDMGVIQPFTRISPREARRLYYSKYEKPSTVNPYWYLHGSYIGYLGIGNINISTVEMGLITSFDPWITHSIDDDLPILTDFGDEIFKDMAELGRFALLIPEERTNQGAYQPEGSPPGQRMTSVNKSVENLFNIQEDEYQQ